MVVEDDVGEVVVEWVGLDVDVLEGGRSVEEEEVKVELVLKVTSAVIIDSEGEVQGVELVSVVVMVMVEDITIGTKERC